MFDPSLVDLLIVDDDDEFRASVVRRFVRRGFQVKEANGPEAALELVARREFQVAVFDMVMPGMTGVQLLEKVRADGASFEVILLTGQGTIESAVKAMKLGAYDYLTKPTPLAEIEILIEKAYERHQLGKENRQLRAALERTRPHWKMIGESAAMRDVFRLIERAGPSDKSILILGESGTGKELVARALHDNSKRADKPFVAINCTALSETLLESELFGHEKGSFTGASVAKQGLFEIADGGTLFIDEMGEMPASMQAKLLRVLEDGSMRRVGSLQERRVNTRVISATNRNLSKEVEEKRFREDLYYRINVMSIDLPPLRSRTGDVQLLISNFLGENWTIESDCLAALESFPWPGNVRQLINVLERAKILSDDGVISMEDLPHDVATCSTGTAAVLPVANTLAALERSKVVEILNREHENKTRAAKALGITRRSLYRLIDKYGVLPEPNVQTVPSE